MDIRPHIFAVRSYTPIPLIIAVLILAEPNLYTVVSGGVITCLGELLRLWAVGYAGSATRTRQVGAPALVTSGPFGLVRNPIYLGNLILSLGLCVMAWPWMPYMLGVFLALFGIQYSLIVSLEEQQLKKIFKREYDDYCHVVPRFLPRLKPYKFRNKTHCNLQSALRSERRTFQSTIIVMIAIILRWQLF